MNTIILKTIKVSEIKGSFIVPAYQRGYRWGKEAIRLLDDILEIDTESDNRYCLQPIVIKKLNEEQYELIDGQQRLTTLFLIYKVMKANYIPSINLEFDLSYEIRTRSKEYLDNIEVNNNEANDNIDFYYIRNAYLEISKWFAEQNNPTLVAINLFKTLCEKVEVIWYEADRKENGNQLFQRLNIGKIPLTSSELVRAIFLSNSNGNLIQNKQEEIALQWDNIEKELNNDSFWLFLTNSTDSKYQTRIDLVLNLISKSKENDDKYATFFYFYNLRQTDPLLKIRNDIQHTFLILKDWYNNHDFYHRIGYLISAGIKLQELYNLSLNKTKNEFNDLLIGKIKQTIKLKDKNYGELSYEDQTEYKYIKKLLLLYNVEAMRIREEDSQRFPFDKYKNNKWSLEHIHAQQSEDMQSIDAMKKWLELHKESLDEVGEIQINLGKTTKDELDSIKKQITEISNVFNKEKFNELKGKIERIYSNDNRIYSIHSISNLALLNVSDNSALNNSTFDVKRNAIIKMIKEGKYIPYCTQMVFLKFYTPSKSNQLYFWGEEDRKAYVKDINMVLKDYIEPITITKESE